MPTSQEHATRFAWALLASLLIHLVLIGDLAHLRWWPVTAPSGEMPALEVRFLPIPEETRFPSAARQANSHKQPPSHDMPEVRITAPSVILEKVIPIDPPEEAQDSTPADGQDTPPSPLPREANNEKIIQQLPPSGKLIYQFYWGKARWLAGLAVHQWVIENGRYTLSSQVSTTGLFGLLHPTRLVETARGIITDAGLRPLEFSTQWNEHPPAVAIFDWDAGYYRWFRGKASFIQPLTATAYDKISFLYQLYIAADKEKFFSPEITMGKRLEHYEIQDLGLEEIEIDGKIHPSIHLKRATSSADLEQIEIWLSTTNNHLPIKMTYSNSAGDHFEQLISSDSIVAGTP